MSCSFSEAFLEAMRFEHWLRFYFAADAGGGPNPRPEEQEGASAGIGQKEDVRRGVEPNFQSAEQEGASAGIGREGDARPPEIAEREGEPSGAGEGDAVIRLPEGRIPALLEARPFFAEMLEALQGRPVSLERSRDALFACLGRRTGILPGTPEFEREMEALAGDAAFRRQLDFFHSWVQELADNAIDLQGNALPPNSLPCGEIPSFPDWEKAFFFWYGMQTPQDSQPPR